MTYEDKLLQDVEDYVRRYERHLPVDIVGKFNELLGVVIRQRAVIRSLKPERDNPDALHERNQQGGVPVPQKFVQGSWVDA
jgi:hypothetical protein